MTTKDEPPKVAGPWEGLVLTERSGGVRFSVHVRPRSSRSSITGVREGNLDVALTSPPADGAANDELLGLLAKALRVRRTDLSILVGASSRGKLIAVNGITPEEARTRLSQAKR
ncbi:MAG: DUF167 domain-containing protein [Byssovorax sp.]